MISLSPNSKTELIVERNTHISKHHYLRSKPISYYIRLAKLEKALAKNGVFMVSRYPIGFNWLVETYILWGLK